MATRKSVGVTVDDAHVSDLRKVAQQLRSKGMKVDEVLEATGLITGSCSKSVSALKKVRGVAAVEEQTQFHLPEPGEPS